MTASRLIKSYEYRQGRRDAWELFNTLEADMQKCYMLIQHGQKMTQINLQIKKTEGWNED